MKSKQPKRPKHQQQQQQQQQQNQQQQQLRQINEGFIKTSVYGNQADRLTEKCIVVGGLERVAALNHQGTVGHCRRLLSECTVHAIHTDQLLRVYIEITGDVDASQFEQGLADIWKTPQLHVAVCHGSARDALVSESTKAAADAEAKDAKTADTVKIEDTVKDEGTVTQDNPSTKFGNLKRLALPDSPDAKYPLHYLGRHLSVMPTAPFCLVCVFNGSEKDIKIGEEVTLILRALLLTGPMGENGVQRLFNTVRNFDVQFIMALRENGENSENDDKETPGAATWRYYEKIDDPNTGRAHQYQAKNEGYSSIIIESVTKGWLNLILANRNNNYPSSVHNASTGRSNGLMGVDRATRSRGANTTQQTAYATFTTTSTTTTTWLLLSPPSVSCAKSAIRWCVSSSVSGSLP
ncbi:hypothetical protein GQ42DRAFT_159222 [Ramicandelaber brevisporus]|nr:hypothetical protein GQ42DRAFT_159222 [Ramicandelaber brevisporus]